MKKKTLTVWKWLIFLQDCRTQGRESRWSEDSYRLLRRERSKKKERMKEFDNDPTPASSMDVGENVKSMIRERQTEGGRKERTRTGCKEPPHVSDLLADRHAV